MNAYEEGSQRVIPAVLIYARFEGQILMIERRSDRPDDIHSGKWNGLGGKHELGESPEECASREFEEEAGPKIAASRFKWCGLLVFPNFKPHKKEDWWVNVFTLELTPEERTQVKKEQGREGRNAFVSTSSLLGLNLWPGDRLFLPWVIEQIPFQGTLWYQNGQVFKHQLSKI